MILSPMQNTTNYPPQWQVYQTNKGNQHWVPNITTQKAVTKDANKASTAFQNINSTFSPPNTIHIPVSPNDACIKPTGILYQATHLFYGVPGQPKSLMRI